MRRINFQKKVKNSFSLVDAVNTEKIRHFFVTIIFFKEKMGFFCVSYNI